MNIASRNSCWINSVLVFYISIPILAEFFETSNFLNDIRFDTRVTANDKDILIKFSNSLRK